ncbi:MAG: hypothetical protein EAZ25_30395 [Oscillatoriales cyanobacterium]|nr:MAG: hypothetical protein EAZ25_30395 [Oscillatoriales cyanobacterium]
MTQNSKIYAPNVYLFAYHLCKLPETESISPGESTKLWEKCNEILQTKLAVGKAFNGSYLPKKDEPLGWRVELINKQVVGGRNSLAFAKDISFDNQQINLKGFAQPLRIDDSYALGLQIRVPEKVFAAYSLAECRTKPGRAGRFAVSKRFSPTVSRKVNFR